VPVKIGAVSSAELQDNDGPAPIAQFMGRPKGPSVGEAEAV